MQTRQAQAIYEKQRQDRLRDEARSEAADAAAIAERKAFTSYRFARILERYTKECALVGSDHDTGLAIKPVPELVFPSDVDWVPLGPLKAAEIRDFQNTIPLVKSFAQGQFNHCFETGQGEASAKAVYTDAAARLGRTAWRLAEALRSEAGLPPFTFVEDGWDYAASIQES
jgi:hypothetical protein